MASEPTTQRTRFQHVPANETKLEMLHYMKLTREIEDRIERKLYRQGRIVGGVYVGLGQEAISVGTAIHMEKDDIEHIKATIAAAEAAGIGDHVSIAELRTLLARKEKSLE